MKSGDLNFLKPSGPVTGLLVFCLEEWIQELKTKMKCYRNINEEFYFTILINIYVYFATS